MLVRALEERRPVLRHCLVEQRALRSMPDARGLGASVCGVAHTTALSPATCHRGSPTFPRKNARARRGEPAAAGGDRRQPRSPASPTPDRRPLPRDGLLEISHDELRGQPQHSPTGYRRYLSGWLNLLGGTLVTELQIASRPTAAIETSRIIVARAPGFWLAPMPGGVALSGAF